MTWFLSGFSEYEKNKAKIDNEFSWIVNSRGKLQCKEDAFENIAGLGKFLRSPRRAFDRTDSYFRGYCLLGRGKYGIVFLSKHVSTQKYVAIKYISKQVVYQNRCVKKIQQELNVLQTINHPFAIKCLGAFTTQGSIALIFEYAFGGELYTRMKKRHKMSGEEAKFYFCEIVSVLRYLHDDLNIVFRDLKPENILIDYEGHIKLVDFGFAVTHVNDSGDPIFDLRDGCGTIMYMSPGKDRLIPCTVRQYCSFISVSTVQKYRNRLWQIHPRFSLRLVVARCSTI